MNTREELSPTPPLQPGEHSALRAAASGGDDSLEQVRDLLFGSTFRNQSRRVVRIEERLVREIAALRSDVTLRLDAMRDELSTEISSLSRSVAEERTERARIEESVAERVEEMRTSLDLRPRDRAQEYALYAVATVGFPVFVLLVVLRTPFWENDAGVAGWWAASALVFTNGLGLRRGRGGGR